MIVAPQQNDIDEPRNNRQHRFIDIFAAEQIVHVEQAAAQRQGQQHHADLGDVEHFALNAHQRRHFAAEGQLFILELVVDPRQLQRIQRGDDQRGVREERQADMHQHPRGGFQVGDIFVRHECGESQVDQREGIDDRQQQPAAIARGHDSHHRTDHQADQRPDVQ